MTDTEVAQRDWLAARVLELERMLQARDRTISVLSEALALNAAQVDVPDLKEWIDMSDVRQEVRS